MSSKHLIKLNLDSRSYREKPTGAAVGALRNRLCSTSSIREVTAAELMDAVEQGRSFTPAAMTGRDSASWKSQELICADIDNNGTELLQPQAALELLRDLDITPCIMYHTMSSTAQRPKYRIIWALDEPLTDPAEAERLTRGAAELFNSICEGCADTAVKDPARLFFGSRPGCMIYKGGDLISKHNLSEAVPEEAPKEARTAPAPAGMIGGSYDSLMQRFQSDKNSFDLAAYVEQTTSSRKHGKHWNPCPICGHDDCFQITGTIYHCFSDSDGSGGSIIDYLIHKEHLTEGEACERFKFDIMGYDKNEWMKAWKDSTQPAAAPAKDSSHDNDLLEWDEVISDDGDGEPEAAEDPEKPAADPTPVAPEEKDKPKEEKPAKPDNIRDYINNRMIDEVKAFPQPIKTGFTDFDAQFDGLYDGLYIIGAVPSLGKTTFCHQMADQIAAAGHDVLYFSLEQSRLELVSKTIARRLAQRDSRSSVTSLDIRRGWIDKDALQVASEYLDEIGDRLSIIEGSISFDISVIEEKIRHYVTKNSDSYPVIFIDYLQIIKPRPDPKGRRLATKDAIEDILAELKNISKKYHLAIIVISSLNRTSYLLPISFESLKETGGIEYTADAVFGLQLQCMDDPIFVDSNKKIKEQRAIYAKHKRENPRKVELVCLKNRYGRTDFICYFSYRPDVDLIETDEGDSYFDDNIISAALSRKGKG